MASEFEQLRQAEPKSRIQRRQARVVARAERVQKQQSREKDTEQKKPTKIRLIPIWLRLLIVAILLVVSMTAGIMFGYGVIGSGKAMDALKFSTWEHLVDLVVKGTDENK
ncbi:DNA-directed RNA polymerase subunit beta [Schinkia azotoformans MEV2011]|uniref:DNA-directed RNA polymerase subunit beta n=1 Tax=Schinkia azotoformans MEV2011 TaxID=1348973 RepID=A0A072NKM1_SCHAZ|nr:DNA-directed RNA polymerase subunit beta [Schinkia azotoformans]KEF38224.1 DNA-directed RNA polymerase subunit beta [Schinkia azotoformans MEV2011]MEC1697397.1 DNA-directed RNA polymerase subunit beta [Schinkia azotoformans]MEC1714286.1 DNA-directed RNA polymerase subunit beta [Schinkia azotoformans]MEC1723416.1 DNA-directed RNA polymerase subunit beta [Schinkia azotoformans]MEC1741299.1 DNA-directed RNA polymerase subunit beta [Schinkia azotoformans]